MHKLDRPSDEPTALAHARKHYANNWESVTPEDRQSIREKLIPMQNGCCAYCERKVNENGHIEHFLKKAEMLVAHLSGQISFTHVQRLPPVERTRINQ